MEIYKVEYREASEIFDKLGNPDYALIGGWVGLDENGKPTSGVEFVTREVYDRMFPSIDTPDLTWETDDDCIGPSY